MLKGPSKPLEHFAPLIVRFVTHSRQMQQSAIANLRKLGQGRHRVQECEKRSQFDIGTQFFPGALRLNFLQHTAPGGQRFGIAMAGTNLMLQCPEPPPYFLEIDFTMLVRQSVYDVLNFNEPLLQRFKQQEPRRQAIEVGGLNQPLTSFNLVAELLDCDRFGAPQSSRAFLLRR